CLADRSWVFGAWIIIGNHHEIGTIRGSSTHQSALRGVTVSSGADNHANTSRSVTSCSVAFAGRNACRIELRAQGVQYCFDSRWLVRVINNGYKVLAFIDTLHAARYCHLGQSRDESIQVNTCSARHSYSKACIGDVEITRQWQLEIKGTRDLCLDNLTIFRWINLQRYLLLPCCLYRLLPRHHWACNHSFPSALTQHRISLSNAALFTGMRNRPRGRDHG